MRLHTLQGAVSWERSVPHHAQSASTVRRWLSDAVSDIGHSGLRDLHAVATELVCNAVRHAAALPGGFLRVFCQRGLTVVEFAVTDGRSATSPKLRRLSATAPDGRGLHIVSALATDWGYHDDGEGRTVWARLSVDESEPHNTAAVTGASAGTT